MALPRKYSSDSMDDESDFDGDPGDDDRMRDMLAMYYGMAAAEPIEEEDTDATDADAKPAAPATPSSLRRIDDAQFDALGHVRQLLTNAGLQTLLETDDSMVHDIKMLDGELQMLVYENYSKFIAATDTIRRMKTNVSGMDDKMGALLSDMQNVADAAGAVQEAVKPSLAKVDELVRVKSVLERLSFLLSLPQELKSAIADGRESHAIAVYRNTSSILLKHRHLSSFGAIRIESVGLMKDLKLRLEERLEMRGSSFKDQLVTCHHLFRLGGLKEHAGKSAYDDAPAVSEEFAKMVGVDLHLDRGEALRRRVGLWGFAIEALDDDFAQALKDLEEDIKVVGAGMEPRALEAFEPRVAQFLLDLASAARAAMRCFASALNEASAASHRDEGEGDEQEAETETDLRPPAPALATAQLERARSALVARCTRLLDGYVPVLNRFLLAALAADGAPLGRMADEFEDTASLLSKRSGRSGGGSRSLFADMDDNVSVASSFDGSDAEAPRIPRMGEVAGRSGLTTDSEMHSEEDQDSGFEDGMEARYDGAGVLSKFLDQLALLPSALPELHSEERTAKVLQIALKARLAIAFKSLADECKEALETVVIRTVEKADTSDLATEVSRISTAAEETCVNGIQRVLRSLSPLLSVARDVLERPSKRATEISQDPERARFILPEMLCRCIWAFAQRIGLDVLDLAGLNFPMPLEILADGAAVLNEDLGDNWIEFAVEDPSEREANGQGPAQTPSDSAAEGASEDTTSPKFSDCFGRILALARVFALLRNSFSPVVRETLSEVFGASNVMPMLNSVASNERLGIKHREKTFEDDMGNIVPQTPLEILNSTFSEAADRLAQRWCEVVAATTLEKSGFRRSLKARAECSPHQLKGVRLATLTLVQDFQLCVEEAGLVLDQWPPSNGAPATIHELRFDTRALTMDDSYGAQYRAGTAASGRSGVSNEMSFQMDMDLELANIERRLVQGARHAPPPSTCEDGKIRISAIASSATQLLLRGAMETVRTIPNFSTPGFQQLHLDATFLKACAPLLVAQPEQGAMQSVGYLLEDLVRSAAERSESALPPPLDPPVLVSKCNEAKAELGKN